MRTSSTIILIIVLLSGLSALVFYVNSNRLETGTSVGNLAEDIEFTTINGTSFRLGDQRGKIVLVDFVTTSCPVCAEEFKVLQQVETEGKVTLVSINLDGSNTNDLTTFSRNNILTWAFGNSEKAGVDYRVDAVPTLIIIDGNGVIRYRGYYTSLGDLDQIINKYSQ